MYFIKEIGKNVINQMEFSDFPIIPVKLRKEQHFGTYFYFSFTKISIDIGRSVLFATGTTAFPYKCEVPLVRPWQEACPCEKGKIWDVSIFLHS